MTFVGPEHTTREWQLHESGIAVWAIGAQEQHGYHLPLSTDTIQADYWARFVAEELEAALLPTLPYGTSMEHKGYRGTISLNPDLLMQFIRQMVTELEAQFFRRLIIINGHGGNFALFPAVREINRQDRDIKVLAVSPYEFRTTTRGSKPEVHAGESETSVMLALDAPVGDERRDCDPFEVGFLQSDLNTFGVGRVGTDGDGAWGYPSKATKARGTRYLKSVKKHMLLFIRERLALLDRDQRYAGSGPVALRNMREDDLPFCMHLTRTVNWNQLEDDWQLLMSTSAGDSYVAMHNGRRVGTVTAVCYQDRFSWVGMVLVDPSVRRCGVGTALLKRAIAVSRERGVVGLDATPDGQKLYKTLGFEDDAHLSRMVVTSASAALLEATVKCEPMRKANLSAVINYDEKIFGAGRKQVLTHLFEHNARYAFVHKRAGKICGYCLGRSGYDCEQIGPIIADDDEIAQSLLLHALTASKKKSVLVDCFDDKDDFYQLLESLGFVQERTFVRMFLGKRPAGINQDKQYAITGPELG